MSESIHSIVFDLGGVLINIDYERTIQAFEKLGATAFRHAYSQFAQQQTFDQFETGKITDVNFRLSINEYCATRLTDAQFDDAWNAMLLDFPLERMLLLEKLATRYRIFLLSNTNEIHIRYFSAFLDKQFGYQRFCNAFEKVYYSHQIGLRKPDREVFGFVISENGLIASETLFIDDSPQHIKGAADCQIQAIQLTPPDTIVSLLGKTISE